MKNTYEAFRYEEEQERVNCNSRATVALRCAEGRRRHVRGGRPDAARL